MRTDREEGKQVRMFADSLRDMRKIVGITHATTYFGALIFLKWLFNTDPQFMEGLNLEKMSDLCSGQRNNIYYDLREIFSKVEQLDPEEYSGLFNWINFSEPQMSSSGIRHQYLREIIEVIDATILDEREMLAQLLLQVEYTSVETPTSIAELISALVVCRAKEKILDPVSGSASLLLACADEDAQIFALERNRSIWFFAKLNAILSGFSSAHIYNQDCFSDAPVVSDKFDVIVGNPPWGMRVESWNGEIKSFDGLPFTLTPKSMLDYAFVMEMIHRMNPVTGRVAVLVSNGMLTRSGAEEKIRRLLIERNLLDCVIALPEKMFGNTAVGASILLFKSSRTTDSVLFVDARHYATQSRGQNYLSHESIDQISSVVRARESKIGSSRLVSSSEIAEQNFTISVPRYVINSPVNDLPKTKTILERKNNLVAQVDRLTNRIDIIVNDLRRKILD